DAALGLLGCPLQNDKTRRHQQWWMEQLIGRLVWDVVPIERLQHRVEDSLRYATKQYVPEQNLTVGLYSTTLGAPEAAPQPAPQKQLVAVEADTERASAAASRAGDEAEPAIAPTPLQGLAIANPNNPEEYIPWGEIQFSAAASDGSTAIAPSSPVTPLPVDQVRVLERSVNLTVNPLTNPEGGVRGGLVVLEDISQEKRMKTTMYRYMTPGVAEQVMALGDDALMVGERKEVTILFSDIRGYTTLTEQLEPAEVVSLLNAYFGTMVEAVFNFEGTLDKFIGDALMAVFGAPLPLDNHGWMAVQSALDMRRRLAEFNYARRHTNQPKIRIGVGISSGEVVSGNIGSQRRMDYTVIGDGVNVSSRLEGVTKEYGCDIILSETTYRLCHDRIWVRELDRIRVKGKEQALGIYELIGDRTQPLDPATEEFLELYQAARRAYLTQDFQQAIQRFEEAKRLREDDQAIAVHISRAYNYLLSPPPTDWDGVHIMTTK
ncbi:MAG TPA: adenylate/guanylate cyclase domain-containing protein, partial [Chroococcidiopsis sp.]